MIERQTNNLYQNFQLGLKQLLDEFGKCIFMEDDNIVSSSFLEYMNNGLSFYNDNKKIMAIGGFNVPVSLEAYPSDYKYNYYLSRFFCAAGFATWSDRQILEIINYNDGFGDLMADKKLYKKFKIKVPHLISELKRIKDGILDAGDYKITFNMIKNDLYMVKPINSNVNNIGYDGTGVHCGISNKFDNQTISNDKIIFSNQLNYDEKIDKVWRIFFDKKPSLYERITNKIKRGINGNTKNRR